MSDEREPPTPELNIDEKFAERMHYQTRIATLERDLAAAQAERDERQDMANVGEALMETIKRNLSPHWSWNDCPSEVVVDLINERDEARAEAAALRALLRSVVRKNIAFRWDGEKQCHVPWIMVEFAEVAGGEPNTAPGWLHRDAFAAAIDQARGAA